MQWVKWIWVIAGVVIALVSLLFLLLYCYGLGQEHQFEAIQVNEVSIKPKSGTSILKFGLKGEVYCPVSISSQMNSEEEGTVFLKLQKGFVDTVFLMDWYDEELSFKVDKLECLSEKAIIKVTLY